MNAVLEFFFSGDPNRLIGTTVNVAILVIGAVGVIEVILANRRLTGMSQALRDLSERVARDKLDASSIATVGRSISATSLLGGRLRALEELKRRGADVDTSSFAATALSELDREARWARWASSNVVLLGLGGTLVGLSQAVVAALPLLRSLASVPDAEDAVVSVFSGLGTAFSTTLMGVSWALILGLLLGHFRSRQQHFLQILEEFSQVYIYPAFRTSAALAMVEAARTLATLEERIGKDLTEIVGQVRMQGMALTKTVEDSVSGLKSEVAATANSLRQSTEQSLSEVVRETKERGLALVSTIDRSLSALTEEVRDGNAAALVQVSSVAKSIHQLVGAPGTDAQSLAAILAQLEEAVQGVYQSTARMTQMVPALEEAIAQQVDRQTRDLHEAMHAYTSRLGSSLERQDALIGQGLDRLERGVGGFGDMLLSQLQTHDTQLIEGVGKQLEPIATLLGQQAGHLKDMRQVAEGLATAAAGLDRRGDDIRVAMGEARHSAGGLAHQLEQLGASMDALVGALKRSASQPGNLGSGFSAPLGPAVVRPATPPQATPTPPGVTTVGTGRPWESPTPTGPRQPVAVDPQTGSSPVTPKPPTPPAPPAGVPGPGGAQGGLPPKLVSEQPPSPSPEGVAFPPKKPDDKKSNFWSRLFGWK